MFKRIINFIMVGHFTEEEKQPLQPLLVIREQKSSLNQYTVFKFNRTLSRHQKKEVTDCKLCPKCIQRQKMEKQGIDQRTIGRAIRAMN